MDYYDEILGREFISVHEKINNLMTSLCSYQNTQMDKFSEIIHERWSDEEFELVIVFLDRFRREMEQMRSTVCLLENELSSFNGHKMNIIEEGSVDIEKDNQGNYHYGGEFIPSESK